VVSAVTLELTPDESELLDLARSVGALSLVLRNQSDKNPVRTVGATKRDLFGMKDMPAPAPAKAAPIRAVHHESAPAGPCVEVFQGSGRILNCFKQ
jgi:pilus assembly protein CpaB